MIGVGVGWVSGNPQRLEGYTEATVPSVQRLGGALERYRAAIAAFNAARPNDLDTRLDDLSAEIEATVERLVELDRIPAAFAGAFKAHDAAWQTGRGLGQVRWAPDDARFRAELEARRLDPDATAAETAELADALFRRDALLVERLLDQRGISRTKLLGEADAARAIGVTTTRTTVNGTRLINRQDHLRAEHTRRPYQRNYHRNPALRATHTRAQRRALATRDRLAWRQRVATIERQVDDASDALRAQRPITAPGQAFATTRTAGALRLGGRALGGVGIALSFADGYGDYQRRDWGGLASNAASIAGSVMLGTPLAPVGAVLVAGSLIHEYREPLGALLTDPVDTVRGWFD